MEHSLQAEVRVFRRQAWDEGVCVSRRSPFDMRPTDATLPLASTVHAVTSPPPDKASAAQLSAGRGRKGSTTGPFQNLTGPQPKVRKVGGGQVLSAHPSGCPAASPPAAPPGLRGGRTGGGPPGGRISAPSQQSEWVGWCKVLVQDAGEVLGRVVSLSELQALTLTLTALKQTPQERDEALV